MGNIQSGINQFLSQAAILGRLAPGFEERQENYKLAREGKLLKKEYDQTIKGLKESGYGEEEYKQTEKTHKRMIDLRERQFQNRPTEKSYKEIFSSKNSIEEIKKKYNQIQNERAQELASKQLQQKMDFAEFKKQLTVRDLPQNLQERAYNEYTSKE